MMDVTAIWIGHMGVIGIAIWLLSRFLGRECFAAIASYVLGIVFIFAMSNVNPQCWPYWHGYKEGIVILNWGTLLFAWILPAVMAAGPAWMAFVLRVDRDNIR